MLVTAAANGGRGGDGTAPGAGGPAGADGFTGEGAIDDSFNDGAPGNPCAPVTSASLTPSVISGTHIIGTSPCPQTFGTATLTNTGTTGLTWSTSPPSGIATSPLSGTLQPGQSVNIAVNFTCSRAQSFSGTLVFIVRGVNNGPFVNRTLTVNATVQ